MEKIVFWLWETSYRAAVVIVAVLLIRRLFLRKFPTRYSYYLWGVVALSLIVPLGISSPISLYNIVPDGGTVASHVVGEQSLKDSLNGKNKQQAGAKQAQNFKSGQKLQGEAASAPNISLAEDAVLPEDNTKTEGDSVSKVANDSAANSQNASSVEEKKSVKSDSNAKTAVTQNEKTGQRNVQQTVSVKRDINKALHFIFLVWLSGVAIGLAWMIGNYIRLRGSLRRAERMEDGVYLCEHIPSPFVFGLLHPAVYLPRQLGGKMQSYILAHENYHIARKDYLTKLLASGLLILYWFHPLVWVAYVMMERDMEMSCDEYVLRDCDKEQRAQYSESLLHFAMRCPNVLGQITFGAHTTKHRVKNVLAQKRTKKYIGIFIVVLAGALIAVFLTNGNNGKATTGKQAAQTSKQPTQNKEIVTLHVLQDSSGKLGEQSGWYAKLLEQRFGIKLIVEIDYHDSKDIYQDIDLFIWNKDQAGNSYFPDLEKGVKENRLAKLSNGSYYYEMQYGDRCHDDFTWTWDVRYDLYEKCGAPTIANFADFRALLKQMKQASGNKYAISLTDFGDTKEAVIAPASSLLSAYYGYSQKSRFWLYNAQGETQDLLGTESGTEGDTVFIQSLKRWNECYRDGLLDPQSRTDSYEDMMAKVQSGKVLWYPANFVCKEYNTEKHLQSDQAMYPVVPEDAVVAVYRNDMQWICNLRMGASASSKHLDKIQELFDYLVSPLGMMECTYGPEGLCWYYDKEGKAHLTDLGEACQTDMTTELNSEDQQYAMYNGFMFCEGSYLAFVPYLRTDINPDSGETYDAAGWSSRIDQRKSTLAKENNTTLWTDWQEQNDAVDIQDYMEKRGNYTIYPESNYIAIDTKKYPSCYKQVSKILREGSWDAIFAETDQQFEQCIDKMIRDAKEAGYEKCLAKDKKEIEAGQ